MNMHLYAVKKHEASSILGLKNSNLSPNDKINVKNLANL